jgi:membrane-bound lytic murein transglycosylase B
MSADDGTPGFDDLVRGLGETGQADEAEAAAWHSSTRAPARRGWIVLSIGAGLAGLASLGLSLLAAGLGGTPVAAAPTDTPVAVISAPTASPEPSPDSVSRSRGVSELPDPEWVATVAERTGIPSRPLSAYAGAALRISEESPGCGLGWNTLAGIGAVETEHGTVHGGSISPGGMARPTIIGIALDGTASDAIRDTDGGALDNDPVWDRAVGPMQFIPETWALFASDGSGDGLTDINNIDDAALTAGRYLCASGGTLADPSHWITAISSYNSSLEYNNKVAAAATFYAG